MKTLFNQPDVSEIFDRMEKLSADSPRQWGKMNAAQMLAHCHLSMETARGNHFMKRVLIGRIIGGLLKPQVLNDKPFSKNSPTDKTYIFTNKTNLHFETEKTKLKHSIQQFFEGGASKCTTYPHPFFGHFTSEQWAVFQWKHLDHHLRQFGV